MVAGAIAPRDAIVERVLGPLLDTHGFGASARGQGAGFTFLADLSQTHALGPALAEVLWRSAGARSDDTLQTLPPSVPSGREAVVLGAADRALRGALALSSWRDVKVVDLALEHGYHEALGAVALAVAAKLVGDGQVERALVLSGSGHDFAAMLFGSAPAKV